MKNFIPFLFLLFSLSAFAQSKLPIDAATGKVSFKTTIPLRAGISNEAAFALVENWFNENPALFSRVNRQLVVGIEKPAVSQQRMAVEEVFANKTPLQALDPASNRIVGKVVMLYHGKSGGGIQHLYVQYCLLLQIENHVLHVSACEVTYNHFSVATFQPQRFLNYSNSNACDAVNYMEYLIDCENRHEEFLAFYDFFNQDVEAIFNNLNGYIMGNKAITQNTASCSSSAN